jgi:hypothetical protein
MTIIAPASTPLSSPWTLTALSTNFADVGAWSVTLQAVLTNYSTISATSIINPATVLDPCAGSIINTSSIATPLTYQISFAQTAAFTIASFNLETDSAGIALADPMKCGAKTFTSNLAWVSVLIPADPTTTQLQLQVSTNDYLLAGTQTLSLVVAFANTAYTGTLTETVVINMISPCTQTIITAQPISDINFPFG